MRNVTIVAYHLATHIGLVATLSITRGIHSTARRLSPQTQKPVSVIILPNRFRIAEREKREGCSEYLVCHGGSGGAFLALPARYNGRCYMATTIGSNGAGVWAFILLSSSIDGAISLQAL